MNEAREGISWAGLGLGTLALAISTQAGYSLANQTCGRSPGVLVLIAAGSLVLALVGGLLSFRSWRRSGQGGDNETYRSAPVGMMASIGTLAAMLFSLVIVLQGAAIVLLSGCLR